MSLFVIDILQGNSKFLFLSNQMGNRPMYFLTYSVKEHSYIWYLLGQIGRRLSFLIIYSNGTQKDHTVKLKKIIFPSYLAKKPLTLDVYLVKFYI